MTSSRVERDTNVINTIIYLLPPPSRFLTLNSPKTFMDAALKDPAFNEYLTERGEKIYMAKNMEALQQVKYLSKDSGAQYTSAPSFAVAPLETPPVRGGLTHCFGELYTILTHVPYGLARSPPLKRLQQVIADVTWLIRLI